MKNGTEKIIIVAVLLLAMIAGSMLYSNLKTVVEQESAEAVETVEHASNHAALNGEYNSEKPGGKNSERHLRDKELLYDGGNEVVTMYLTVSLGNASEGTDHTWEEINTYPAYYYDNKGIDRYKAEAILQVGTEEGIPIGSLGYGETVPNAIVQVRGQSSSENPQKNYKIELKENKGAWNGQTTIDLNKHMSEGLRFRNKIGFDLLAGIDELMSLRTSFVHLYVNDLTDGSNDGFEDYGLYTQVEQLNKTALKAHGLDKNGHLYKINYYEFLRYKDVIELNSDSHYNKAKFEEYLEIKGNDDHTKLIAMLEDVNNYGIPIEDVIEKHFDMENLTYFLAFNILTGNYDTQSRNAYLYSPLNSDTWYFLSWDMDACFTRYEYELRGISAAGGWEQGISNYWGNVLFCRCLKSEIFRSALDEAILDVKDYLSKERLSQMAKEYGDIVKPYAYAEPDVMYEPLTPENYDVVLKNLPSLIDSYYEGYLESLEKPQPFFIGTPEKTDLGIRYYWDYSYDFDQEDITYKAVVARNLDCTDIVEKYEGMQNSFNSEKLPEGQYFMKVTATNESQKTQYAFDSYVTEYGKTYGTICFYVDAEGNITLYTADEE